MVPQTFFEKVWLGSAELGYIEAGLYRVASSVLVIGAVYGGWLLVKDTEFVRNLGLSKPSSDSDRPVGLLGSAAP